MQSIIDKSQEDIMKELKQTSINYYVVTHDNIKNIMKYHQLIIREIEKINYICHLKVYHNILVIALNII